MIQVSQVMQAKGSSPVVGLPPSRSQRLQAWLRLSGVGELVIELLQQGQGKGSSLAVGLPLSSS